MILPQMKPLMDVKLHFELLARERNWRKDIPAMIQLMWRRQVTRYGLIIPCFTAHIKQKCNARKNHSQVKAFIALPEGYAPLWMATLWIRVLSCVAQATPTPTKEFRFLEMCSWEDQSKQCCIKSRLRSVLSPEGVHRSAEENGTPTQAQTACTWDLKEKPAVQSRNLLETSQYIKYLARGRPILRCGCSRRRSTMLSGEDRQPFVGCGV